MPAIVASSSNLFYGLFVANSTLFLACDAQEKLEGLEIIDQIIYRRKQGLNITLSGEDSSLLKVPSEIWLEIKRKLIILAVDETEREMFEKYRCDSEKRRRKTGWKKCDGFNASNRGTLASLNRCPRCYKNVSIWSYLEPFGNDCMLERNRQIDQLLIQFGLKRNSRFPITIPKEFKESRLERIKSCSHIYELTYHAVTIASDSSLDLEFLFHSGIHNKASEAQSTDFSSQLFINIYHQRVEIQRRFDLLFDTYKIRAFEVPSVSELVGIDERVVKNGNQNDYQLARWIMQSVVHLESRV